MLFERTSFLRVFKFNKLARCESGAGFYELDDHLEHDTVQNSASFKERYALHRLFKFRRRYVFTAGNRIRLRYMMGAGALCIVAAMAGLAHSPLMSDVHQSLERRYRASDGQEIALLGGNDGTERLALQDHISEGMRLAAEAIKKRPVPLDKNLTIGPGDTVAGILQKAGLSATDSYFAVKALGEHTDLRGVKPGQKLRVHFKPGPDDAQMFKKLTMQISPIKEVEVIKGADETFTVTLHEKELKPKTYARGAQIETSLYGSAMKAGIPAQIIANVIRTYSWNVDFQRDIRSGDKIEVLYETKETDDGQYAKYGDILYANLSVGGKDIPIYRFEMKDGHAEYFEADGQSIKKTLMKTPIDGARLSSGFGMRKHPVLGYGKMHKGMDFAAATGTPIYAAGDGVIAYKGRKGSYGNYIKIRHNGKLNTAYAHMHKFAKGMGTGKRVKQGQVIGYVGTTGRSTGPHLHYEVMVNGVQKNPKSIDLPTGEQLAGAELTRFKSVVKKLDKRYASLKPKDSVKLAQTRAGQAESKILR